MLPESLLCLLNAAFVLAQSKPLLLNSIASLNPANIPTPPSFALPSSNALTITVALCSQNSPARFFVTNSSTVIIPGSGGGENVFEIVIHEGNGIWAGTFPTGGVFAIENAEEASFEVGVSDQGPIHEVLNTSLLLGDTTSNQALLFSPPFAAPAIFTPTYPNYTLPAANPSIPAPPTSSPNYTLLITPTSSLVSTPQTACQLFSQRSSGKVINETLWLRDDNGWRNQWLVNGFSPSTNYTAYFVQDRSKISSPIYFATKSALFSCPLVMSLPYCPNVAYTVPIPPPRQSLGFNAYDATNLPSTISAPLLEILTNFTTTLTTSACGRDLYSPLMSCSDCQREYRKWFCTISFTRCGEPSPGNPGSFTASPAPPGATGLSAVQPPSDDGSQQKVISALVPQQTSSPKRNPNLPDFGSGYTMLLPCLESCTIVDRACPSFLGFRCPTMRFNAAASYGVGYIDSGDGEEYQGVTGTAQDQWGNVWCNGG